MVERADREREADSIILLYQNPMNLLLLKSHTIMGNTIIVKKQV